jgi:hypothetical protein
MVDQVSLGQVFSEFFGFSHQYHSTAVHIHSYINWGWKVACYQLQLHTGIVSPFAAVTVRNFVSNKAM